MTTKPRGEQRTVAILAATLELLAEVGYEQLTIDAIAARARASKTTIYRRWQDKRELVISALERREATHPSMPGDMGSLRADLEALLTVIRELMAGEDRSVFSGLMYVAQRDPVIARAMRVDLVERRRRDCSDVVQRAIGRGELGPGASGDVLFELLIGQVMVRTVLLGQDVDERYAAHLIDDIFIPVLQAGSIHD